MVSSVDENIGKIIQSLKELNLYESSLIFLRLIMGELELFQINTRLELERAAIMKGV